MTDLASPEYDFAAFCRHVASDDYMALIDAVGMEANLAQRANRERTGRGVFRAGSRGRKYCDDLQRLMSLLVNGAVPDGATPEFLSAAKPLVDRLLQRWDIGNLRTIFAHIDPASADPTSLVPEDVDSLVVVASRDQVLACDTSATAGVLRTLTASRDYARKFRERVDIRIHGWDERAEELFENTDVRAFVYKLDEVFPYWLFFLSKTTDGLNFVTLCFLPPYLTPKARAKEFPSRLGDLLTKRWFPAMNRLCEWVGMSESEVKAMTERVVDYFSAPSQSHG